MAMRLQAMGQPNYERAFKVSLQEHMLELPLAWRKPQTVFVNSMSDLFHKEVLEACKAWIFHENEPGSASFGRWKAAACRRSPRRLRRIE